jgi:hypothetical protein
MNTFNSIQSMTKYTAVPTRGGGLKVLQIMNVYLMLELLILFL